MKKKHLLPTFLVLALAALPLLAQTKLAPPSPEVAQTIQSALQKAQHGDLQGAIALIEPLRKPGAHPAVLSLLGSLYLEAGRPKEALELLEPIAQTDAAGPLILVNTAHAALALDQAGKAEKYLKMAAAKAPGSAAARDLGILLGSQKRFEESYLQLHPWALAHPEDTEARVSAAYDALELHRASEAAELLQGLPDDDPRVGQLRGRLQGAQPKTPAGVAPPKPGPPPAGAEPRGDGDPIARNLQAATDLAAQGKVEDALSAIRQEIRLHPTDPRPRVAEVTALLNARRPKDARNAIDGALSSDPQNPDFVYLRGAVKMVLRDYPGAEQDFRQTLQLNPDHVSAMSNLAVLLANNGKKDEARQLLRKVLELNPDDATAKANLEKLGNP